MRGWSLGLESKRIVLEHCFPANKSKQGAKRRGQTKNAQA
jgi:hypothetical protein